MDQQPMLDTKSLFAPKKGKQATKGQKQIYEENKDTIRNYLIVAGVSILVRLLLYFPSTPLSWFLVVFSVIVQFGGVYGMWKFMAKPAVTAPSQAAFVDGGIDLNLKGGFADYLNDLIITTAICTGLSGFSNGFWYLWLWLPGYYAYKFWTSVIAPWVFAPPPDEPAPEVAQKKRKKMERKMARAGYR